MLGLQTPTFYRQRGVRFTNDGTDATRHAKVGDNGIYSLFGDGTTNAIVIAFCLYTPADMPSSGNYGLIGKDNEYSIYTNGLKIVAIKQDESEDKNIFKQTGDVIVPGTKQHFLIEFLPTGDDASGIGLIMVDGAISSDGGATVESGFVKAEDGTGDFTIGAAFKLEDASSGFLRSRAGMIFSEVVVWKAEQGLTDAMALAYTNGGDPIDPLVNSGDYTVSNLVKSYWPCKRTKSTIQNWVLDISGESDEIEDDLGGTSHLDFV